MLHAIFLHFLDFPVLLSTRKGNSSLRSLNFIANLSVKIVSENLGLRIYFTTTASEYLNFANFGVPHTSEDMHRKMRGIGMLLSMV